MIGLLKYWQFMRLVYTLYYFDWLQKKRLELTRCLDSVPDFNRTFPVQYNIERYRNWISSTSYFISNAYDISYKYQDILTRIQITIYFYFSILLFIYQLLKKKTKRRSDSNGGFLSAYHKKISIHQSVITPIQLPFLIFI